jgi:hypothetical protein
MMKGATAYKKDNGIYLHSSSQTTAEVWIATAPYLKVGVEDAPVAKGEAVIAVLNASTKGIQHPKQAEWSGVFAPMLELAGVKSLKVFEKDAVCCGLEVQEGQLSIIPHRKLGPNKGYEPIAAKTVKLAFASPPAEVGAALEEGFSRCQR